MANKAKTNSPRIGQQTKTSAKGAHGGGVKFSQVSLGNGFKNIKAKGANAGKAAAKLPQAKKGISEAATGRQVTLGSGFGTNPFLEAAKMANSKMASSKAPRKASPKSVPAVRAKKGFGRKTK